MPATVAGVDRLLADLAKLEEAAGDLRPVWPVLGRMWAEREQRVFAGANSWAPFAAKTLIEHRHTGKPPMVATGSLVDAMTNPEPRYADASMVVYGPPKADKTPVTVGSRHTRGTAYMPARKIAPRLLAAERREMVEKVRAHLTKGL